MERTEAEKKQIKELCCEMAQDASELAAQYIVDKIKEARKNGINLTLKEIFATIMTTGDAVQERAKIALKDTILEAMQGGLTHDSV